MDSFPDLLRHWRATRRYSQLDLSLEAGVSARHISFLETGRARPSRDMIVHLGEVLAVPLERRNEMLAAVGFAPRFAARDWDVATLEPIRNAVDWTLARHAPYPGFALDRLWVIRAMNAPAKMLFAPPDVIEGASLLEALLRAEVTAAIENWPDVAGHLARRRRSESAAEGGNETLLQSAARFEADASPSEAAAAAISTQFR